MVTGAAEKSRKNRDHALFCREGITGAAGIAAEPVFAGPDDAASRPFKRNAEKPKD